MNFGRLSSQNSHDMNSHTMNSYNINSPNIKIRYILLSRPNSNKFKPKSYRKKINISFNENWLQKNDVILEDIECKKIINKNSLLYDAYSYVHEDLKIPLEDITDIEILFIENKKIINRYPKKNQEIDFKETILGILENTSIGYASVKKNNFDIIILLLKNNLPRNERKITPILRKFLMIRNARSVQNRNIDFIGESTMSIFNNVLRNIMDNIHGDFGENENKETKYYTYSRTFYMPLFDIKESKRIVIPENEIHSFLDEFKFDINDPARNIKNQTTCSICYSEFKKYDDVCFIKKCNHLFHTTCIKKWLTQYGNTCPICKCDVKK